MSSTALHRLPWKHRGTPPVYDEKERLVREMHPHWFQFLPILVAAIPLALAVGLLLTGVLSALPTWPGDLFLLASMFVSTLALHWFFHKFLSIRLNRIIITDRRILFLKTNLWFSDDMHEIVLLRVIAVEVFKRGILQNMLDYGDLWFDTGGSMVEQNQIIPLVPHPYHWVKELSNLAAPKVTRES